MHILYLCVATIVVVVFCCDTAQAYLCACATANVNLRRGPGTSYEVITTLPLGQCLRHDARGRVVGRSYTWLFLEYNGQNAWAASNWLIVQNCSSSSGQPGGGSQVQVPECPRIVTRAEWGARAPARHIGHMSSLPIYVFIHHGASRACSDRASCESKVRGYQNWHMDGHGWSDIGYNFVVGEDGNAYEARGWTEIGAHTKHYNNVGIAICIIGNFTSRLPNQAALTTVQQLIQCGLDIHKISPTYTLKGHRDVGNTACPGDALYCLIQSWPHYVAGSARYDSPVG